MKELMEILKELNDEADYENCKTLIDDHILDSFTMLSLIAEIEECFDIKIPPKELVTANFNSVEGMEAMIKRLQTGE